MADLHLGFDLPAPSPYLQFGVPLCGPGRACSLIRLMVVHAAVTGEDRLDERVYMDLEDDFQRVEEASMGDGCRECLPHRIW